jgi:exosortase A
LHEAPTARIHDSVPIDSEASVAAGRTAGVNVPLLIVLGALVLAALLYWPTSSEYADLWQNTKRRYSHGWVVLAASLLLIWRDRAYLRAIELVPPPGGWILVALLSAAWFVGFNAGLLAVTTLTLPLLALATVWAVGGNRLARRASFPVLFLYFALPVWELINPLLQSLTALVCLGLTRLVGIPVVMDERIIHIPAGWFEIAGGCSGLHFFIVALAIAAVHGEVYKDDARSRWLLLAIAGALALVTNWLRVFVIIVAGHLSDMQHFLVKVDHYYFGWFIFVFALGCYAFLASRIPRSTVASPPGPRAPIAKPGRVVTAAVLAGLALASGPAWALVVTARAVPHAAQPAPSVTGWSGPELHVSDWHPVFHNPDEQYLVAYRNEALGDVALYRAAYHVQRQGKEVSADGNSVVGARYRVNASAVREVGSRGNSFRLVELRAAAADGREILVWSLYAIDGRPGSMGVTSRLGLGLRSLLRIPTVSVIALAADCQPDCDHAARALEAFAADALPVSLAERDQGN